MITIKIILRDNKKSTDDKRYQILFRFTRRHANTTNLTFEIASGYYVPSASHFDKKAQEIKKTSDLIQNKIQANAKLQRKKTEYTEKLDELDKKGLINKMSNKAIKSFLIDSYEETSHTFVSWANVIIKRNKAQNRFGNARAYQSARDFMINHCNKKDISFEEITPTLLKKIEENYIYIEGKSYNGLAAIYRGVRAIINDAIKEAIIGESLYPFKKYSIKSEKTKKRAISADSIRKIEAAIYPKNSQMWHAKNYFMFSFYCMGLNFADMGRLKKLDIAELKNNGKTEYKLTYKREKLKRYSKTIQIYLIPPAMKILNQYSFKTKDANDYLFPIIERMNDEILIRKDLKNKLKTYNKYIKRIQVELEIEQKLTSYVSRHSWASVARDKGYDLRIIGEALGHEDEKTTQIYVESLSTEAIRDYNKNLLD